MCVFGGGLLVASQLLERALFPGVRGAHGDPERSSDLPGAHSSAHCGTHNPASALPAPPAVPKSQTVPLGLTWHPIQTGGQWLQTTATAKRSLQPFCK